ncbi:MAG: hypothetical protein JWN44_5247 [Myxococcales bacterium]|nr:hypothetical protein [Myxococcales bacterium]
MVRRLGVCVLVLLVLGETSGLARAFGPGSTVHCCCGTHASARPCPCPDCPVTMLRAAAHDHATRLMAGRDCRGERSDDPGVLTVVALVAAAPALDAPLLRATLDFVSPSAILDRFSDVARPPP